MALAQIATIRFTDQETADDAIAVVRSNGSTTCLALSLEHGGDVEVFSGSRELDQFIAAFQKARDLSAS
jgi:hypothetical protein